MWYFTWVLGIGVALSFGIVNVMWLESRGVAIPAKQVKTTR
jgi:cyd operon protein YbgT